MIYEFGMWLGSSIDYCFRCLSAYAEYYLWKIKRMIWWIKFNIKYFIMYKLNIGGW